MKKVDSNLTSTNPENKKSISLPLLLLLYVSFISLALVLIIYNYLIVGGLFLATPFIHKFIKNYFSLKPLEELNRRIFNSTRSVVFLIILLIIIALSIIGFNEREVILRKTNSDHYVLGGIVWNEENEMIPDVIIILPEYDLIDTTDRYGRFSFKVSKPKSLSVSIVAQKEEFQVYESEGSFGNSHYNFIMKRK